MDSPPCTPAYLRKSCQLDLDVGPPVTARLVHQHVEKSRHKEPGPPGLRVEATPAGARPSRRPPAYSQSSKRGQRLFVLGRLSTRLDNLRLLLLSGW